MSLRASSSLASVVPLEAAAALSVISVNSGMLRGEGQASGCERVRGTENEMKEWRFSVKKLLHTLNSRLLDRSRKYSKHFRAPGPPRNNWNVKRKERTERIECHVWSCASVYARISEEVCAKGRNRSERKTHNLILRSLRAYRPGKCQHYAEQHQISLPVENAQTARPKNEPSSMRFYHTSGLCKLTTQPGYGCEAGALDTAPGRYRTASSQPAHGISAAKCLQKPVFHTLSARVHSCC